MVQRLWVRMIFGLLLVGGLAALLVSSCEGPSGPSIEVPLAELDDSREPRPGLLGSRPRVSQARDPAAQNIDAGPTRGVPPDVPGEEDEAEVALRGRINQLTPTPDTARGPDPTLRLALIEKYLLQYPSHREQLAKVFLRQALYVLLGQDKPDIAMAWLDKHGVRVGYPEWRLAEFRSDIHSHAGNVEAVIAEYKSIEADAAAPEYRRAQAMLRQAIYLEIVAKRPEEALVVLDELVRRYGDSTALGISKLLDDARGRARGLRRFK